jgi:hypothetical protein
MLRWRLPPCKEQHTLVTTLKASAYLAFLFCCSYGGNLLGVEAYLRPSFSYGLLLKAASAE